MTVLQCTSAYPTPPERVGLNVLAQLRERYGKPVGLSDHSLGNYAAYAAVALGAVVIEKHFTLSKERYGPDAALALEPDELEDLVEGIREIETMLANPIDKDDLEPFAEMKRVFEKSVVAVAPHPRRRRRSSARCSRPRSREPGFRPRASTRSSAGSRAPTSPPTPCVTEESRSRERRSASSSARARTTRQHQVRDARDRRRTRSSQLQLVVGASALLDRYGTVARR